MCKYKILFIPQKRFSLKTLIKFIFQIHAKLKLAIDLGNTLTKFFLFKGEKILLQEKVNSSFFSEKLSKIIDAYPEIESIIYSDVSGKTVKNFDQYTNNIRIIPVNSEMRLPFVNAYESQISLGADRIVLVAAACKKYPTSNVLVIDMGTCITFDFIDRNNTYLGGAISPGFEMRFKALNHYTANLPILKHQTPKNPEGKSTHDAIQAGVHFAILDELSARIDYYQKKYHDLTVILTGGDANKLPKTLKNSIFAHSNFTAEGMLHLLKLNIDS